MARWRIQIHKGYVRRVKPEIEPKVEVDLDENEHIIEFKSHHLPLYEGRSTTDYYWEVKTRTRID